MNLILKAIKSLFEKTKIDIDSKLSKSGFGRNKIICTDLRGNIIEKEVSDIATKVVDVDGNNLGKVEVEVKEEYNNLHTVFTLPWDDRLFYELPAHVNYSQTVLDVSVFTRIPLPSQIGIKTSVTSGLNKQLDVIFNNKILFGGCTVYMNVELASGEFANIPAVITMKDNLINVTGLYVDSSNAIYKIEHTQTSEYDGKYYGYAVYITRIL